MTQKRPKVGDLFAIPLPNGNYAFGRMFQEPNVGIYQHIGKSMEDTPKLNDENYQFNVGVYDMYPKEYWTFLEKRPFFDKEKSWPPPMVIIDIFTGKYRGYHKGIIAPYNLSNDEGKTKEIVAIWGGDHIISRIMGDTKILERQRQKFKE